MKLGAKRNIGARSCQLKFAYSTKMSLLRRQENA